METCLPPFVWLDGCTPLHIHTSLDKYNLAYFISNRHRGSGSCMTYLDLSRTRFDWNDYASWLALAAVLALGFVLMHTPKLLKRVCIFILAESGSGCARMFSKGRRRVLFNPTVADRPFVKDTRSQLGVLVLDVIFIAERFAPAFCVLGSAEPRHSLLCYSCGACLPEPECAEFSALQQSTRSTQ